MEKIKVEEFINGYADAVQKIDIKKIASHFHDHFVLSTQKDYWYISNDDEFRSNLVNAFDGYKKLGAKACKLIKFEILDFKSNHCIVNMTWGLFDDNANLLTEFDISYCIKKINQDLKYIFVIAYNEIERIEEYQRKQKQA